MQCTALLTPPENLFLPVPKMYPFAAEERRENFAHTPLLHYIFNISKPVDLLVNSVLLSPGSSYDRPMILCLGQHTPAKPDVTAILTPL